MPKYVLALLIGTATVLRSMTALAAGELVNDKLAWTPSRRSPLSFALRVALGSACGAAIGSPKLIAGGMAAGALGAVAGTLGGYELRTGLARAAGVGTFR